MPSSNTTLSERLLRYTATASLVTSAGLLTAPPAINANATARDLNCNALTDPNCFIDFDGDGAPEFSIFSTANGIRLAMEGIWFASSDYGNGFVFSNDRDWPAVLPLGATLDNTRTDWAGFYYPFLDASTATGTIGNWTQALGHATDPTQGAYLGLRAIIDGQNMYYGWAEIYVPARGTFIIKRIGYNDTRNGPITTGEGIPTAVHISSTSATTGLRGVIAASLAGLSGALHWLRRRFAQD